MVVRRRKKVRKQRGLRWHGWGAKKKHRGSGSRGGSGLSGIYAHHRTYLYRWDPEHYGKKGFSRPQSLVRKPKTINIHNLEKIARQRNTKEIDLQQLGYDKLLGTGKATMPLRVKGVASESAKKKLVAAGGSVE
jgi:large subunit ribosomal protein L15